MSNIIYLPGCGPKPSQRELVDRATDILMKEVMDVFVEFKVEPGRLGFWYDAIQTYLWAAPINHTKDGNLRPRDVTEWRYYWRDRALTRVRHLRPFC
jgi:hypothetical protein